MTSLVCVCITIGVLDCTYLVYARCCVNDVNLMQKYAAHITELIYDFFLVHILYRKSTAAKKRFVPSMDCTLIQCIMHASRRSIVLAKATTPK